MLDSDESSEAIELDLDVVENNFSSRYEMGAYLVKLFEGHHIQKYMGDAGFWSWFALLWFEQLCPVKNDGMRNPSKDYNYVLSKNYNHRPRHAIYMTWQLVSRYGQEARFMLSKEPSTRGEITEQMMARQEMLSSEGVMRLASALYFDVESGIFKRGAASRTGPGCVYRYVNWLQQLQLTFDIFSTTKDELEGLLPAEFSRFLIAE